jgi:DNA polymerase (family X)
LAVHNADVAEQFKRMAELLEIEGANPFRVRAYRRAAATIEDLPRSIEAMVSAGEDLSQLPGIGEDLAGKIREICATGHSAALEEVEGRTPASLAELTALPGLGPKRVQLLHERLGICTLTELAKAAREGKLRDLPRFGSALEAKLLKEFGKYPSQQRRFKISTAEDFATSLCDYLHRQHGVGEVVVAGSYRRRKETVGDLDILVTASRGADLIEAFTRYDEVDEVIGAGTTRAAVKLKAGIQVDLRVVPKHSYGAALHYFTGSKAHNIAVRKVAQGKGIKLNEYGIFRNGERVGGATEADVFAAAGLPYIEPELREDRGEIAAAAAGRLPHLVTLAEVRGDLHAHTRESDGKNSPEDMAEAAKALGYEYLAITDHSQSVTVAHGLDVERLSAQLDAIDRLNEKLDGIRLLKSCEVDILADGKLDLSNEMLKRLDFAVCAVHSHFEYDMRRQTDRILRAMENRYFTILAHPTGRLIGERPAYAVDLDKVLSAAKDHGCFLEVNAHPARLDLNDVHCRAAKELGILLSLGTDAHSTHGLWAMRYGVDQARRGWLESRDVLNTRRLEQLLVLLRQRR